MGSCPGNAGKWNTITNQKETQMKTLQELAERCKGDVHLTINDHRSNHISVKEYLDRILPDDLEHFMPEAQKAIDKDFLVDLQFYPDTTVGFYKVIHHDVQEAIEAAHKLLDEDQ